MATLQDPPLCHPNAGSARQLPVTLALALKYDVMVRPLVVAVPQSLLTARLNDKDCGE